MTTQPPSPNRTDALLAGIAVLACLPYVALKVAWLSGSTVGLTDPDALATTSMEVANALTLGMELVALALAVALARPAGARLPAWLVGLPMYVGTGLLGGILLVVPIQTVLGLVRGSAGTVAAQDAEPIADWVFGVVYGAFCVLGLALITLFARYGWRRWVRPRWMLTLGELGPVSPGTRRLAIGHGIVMVGVCVVELVITVSAWGTVGGHPVAAVLAAGLALTGLVVLARRRPAHWSARWPMLAAVVGSAVVAAWGLYFAVVLTLPNPLGDGVPMAGALALVGLLRAGSGASTPLVLAALRRSGRAREVPVRPRAESWA